MDRETRPWDDEDFEAGEMREGSLVDDDQVLTPDEMAAKLKMLLILDERPEDQYIETARDDGDAWWIQQWETYDMDGNTYWRASCGYRLAKSWVQRLAQAEKE